MKKNSRFSTEINLLHWLSSFFFLLVVTGLLTWLLPELPPFIEQVSSLLHLYVGGGVIVLFFIYCIRHTKRTIGFRRFGAIVLGSITALLFMWLIISGLILGYIGVLKSYHWLLSSHQWIAIITLIFLIIHILHHVVAFPKRRLVATSSSFSTISIKILKPILIGLCSGGVFVVVILVLDLALTPKENLAVDLHRTYQYPYGNSLFKPSLTSTSSGYFIDERVISGSKQCISCHQEIGKQWMVSAHRHAANDPTYVRNINLLEKKKGLAAARYCEGCHAPIALLTGQLTDGGKHGGVTGTAANEEGISCMSCHGINKLTSSEGVASYNFQPRTGYLFEYVASWPFNYINQQVIKINPRLHMADLLPSVQKTSEYCGSCHTQFMDKSMNSWGWVKMQDELLAWSQSKFNTSQDPRFSHSDNKPCQDCHMPMVKGNDIAANADGEIKSHLFIGSNIMLAKHFGHDELAKLTIDNLQKDKISLTIEPPEDRMSIQSELYLSTELRAQNKFPIALYRGTKNKVTLLISNHGVGHNFPGGSIDLNEAWIELKIFDGNQKLIQSSGELDGNGNIEPTATVYKEVAIDRHGKEVWRHDLFNMVGRSYINVIPSGKTDIVEYILDIPDWAVSPINIQAVLKFRKLNQRYLDWVNIKQNIKFNPVIDVARDSINIKLLKTPSSQVKNKI